MRLFLQQRVTSDESVSHFARRKTPITKGYEVHGIIRRASTFNTSRIDHLYANPHINGVRMFLQYGDLSDSVNLVKLLYDLKPDEIYHLGAQSDVRVSFDIPEYMSGIPGVGTIRK